MASLLGCSLSGLLSSCASNLACCAGSAACSCCCRVCNQCKSSTLARVGFAIFLLLGSIAAWTMLSPWVSSQLAKVGARVPARLPVRWSRRRV